MISNLEPGQSYVVAVSGGVDSVVLLDMLSQAKPDSTCLMVAHFDHGLRGNSSDDAQFVQNLSQQYGLKFHVGHGHLKPKTSEATARKARYDFLKGVVAQENAIALLTAHHQDDFLETAILNFYRGSHRRGLVSLKSSQHILRPLLQMTKAEIVAYAQKHQLAWCEDATNYDLQPLRNRIRWQITPNIKPSQRQQLLAACQQLTEANQKLDIFLKGYLSHHSYRRLGKVFSRSWFNSLDHNQACEIVATWLIENQIGDYSQNQIEYIVVKLKTLRPGKMIEVSSFQKIQLTKRCLRLEF